MSSPRTILCLNPGSSSLRFAYYGPDENSEIAHGHIDLQDSSDLTDYQNAVESILEDYGNSQLWAIGYRVVHGGNIFSAPTLIDDAVVESLRSLERMATAHLPAAITTIEIARQRFPNLKHVACFDTAFHQSMPEYAKRFALPEELWQQGFRRYGFHGLSFEYVVQKLGKDIPERTIIAHLGNGSSMAALKAGQSVDTTMGMTPAGGMMMGSRSGDLDPGVIIQLLRDQRLSPDELDELINQNSGLKAVSGITSDMKTLLAQRKDNPQAAIAVVMYCYHARKQIGALSAVLGGLDLLVFTGGIGENSEPIRMEICQGLDFLQYDTKVISTDETRMMAQHILAIGDE